MSATESPVVSADLVPVEHGLDQASDPVTYMNLALDRAKGWLGEARSAEEVRNLRADARGAAELIKAKGLAFDAQLTATELVRRCERRLGQLAREGQRDGTVASVNRRSGPTGQDVAPVADALGVKRTDHRGRKEALVLGDADEEVFEQAITEGREEGNLSRRNVTAHLAPEKIERVREQDRRSWHRRKHDNKEEPRSEWHYKRRHIDPNRVLEAFAGELDALTAGLELIDPSQLAPDIRDECVASVTRSLKTIKHHMRRIFK